MDGLIGVGNREVLTYDLRHLVALYAPSPFVPAYAASLWTEDKDRVVLDALNQKPEGSSL